ncbi:MAG: mandelate racemase/muconate lactonizing enzyme family protein [Mycobacteriales bacterium]
MRVTDVRVSFRQRPHADDPIRDALQTLTGGGSVSVEIDSDDGLTGRSETSFGRLDGAPRTLATLISAELAPIVRGSDAELVGAVVEAMRAETEYHGSSGVTTFGISAIDVALWDLLGRAHGVPAYRLWGACRDRLPAYAMVGWSNYDLDKLRAVCAAAAEQGFRGVKIKVAAGDLADDVARIEAVRAEVGAGVAVMVDANQALGVDEAIRRGLVFADLGVAWFEEPLPAYDVRGYAELRRRVPVPIATGENLYTAREFRDFLEAGAVGVIQPDLRRAGGPTAIREIASLAAAYDVPYASHGGGPAALSLLMAGPTACWLETGLRSSPEAFPRLEDGCALAPAGPGFAWQ